MTKKSAEKIIRFCLNRPDMFVRCPKSSQTSLINRARMLGLERAAFLLSTLPGIQLEVLP